MNVPNLLSGSRLLLAPLFLFLFLSDAHGGMGDEAWGRWGALAVAVYFEISDVMDGFLARRNKQVSQVGKVLDPLADRVSQFTVFLAFLGEGYASIWAILIIFMREAIVTSMRVLAAGKGVNVAARWSGKFKATIQGIVCITIVGANALRPQLGLEADATGDPLRELGVALMWVVAAVTAVTLIDYARTFGKSIDFDE